MSSYCGVNDLLIDQQMYVGSQEPGRYVQSAADEMDAKLGYVYVVPIVAPPNQMLLLKGINARMASGRLIMSRAAASQDSAVHAYALFLVKSAENDLMALANGVVDLTAPKVDVDGNPIGSVEDPTEDDTYARIPTGWNPDRTSAVTLFEKNIMVGSRESEPWIPAENIESDGGVSNVR